MDGLVLELRQMVRLGLPLIGAFLSTVAIGVTDTIMLGWYSVEALAAGVLAGTYLFSLFLLGAGFAFAASPMVAEAVAQDKPQEVRRVTRMAVWLSVIYGVLVYPAFWWSGPILLLLGQGAEVSAGAQSYLRLAGVGLGAGLIFAALRGTLSGLERTRVVFWATVLGVLANIALNWVFIFGNLGAPELGLLGAAVASCGVHLVMALALWLYLVWAADLREYRFFQRLWRPDWPKFWQVFRLGWPISLTHFSETGLFAATAFMIGWLGTVPLAAHGIAIQIASATFMVHLGLSAAATVRVGAAYGRRDRRGVQLAAMAAVVLSAGAVLVTISAFLILPEALVGLFLDPGEPLRPEIMALGVVLLAVAALFQLFDAAQVMALGFLRGIQDTQVPMYFAFVGYWIVGIPAAYAMGFWAGWGAPGIWLGLVVGLLVAGALMGARFVRLQARL